MSFKQCKVVMLPTDEADRCLLKSYESLQRHPKQFFTQEYLKSIGLTSHHLYILSDDEIKESDWCLSLLTNKIHQCDKDSKQFKIQTTYFKKIIATTDDLENCQLPNPSGQMYLPQILESFIDYFVEQYNKGNVITEVNVEYYFTHETAHDKPLCPKVNPDNTINIQPIKDSWTRKEHEQSLRDLAQAISNKHRFGNGIFDIDKWIEQNVK